MDIRSLLTKIGFDVDHKKLDGVEKQLEGIKHRLEFLAAAEIGRRLFEMGERFAEMGERINVAATSAGISVEAFQKLSYAAEQSAVSQDEMEHSMAILSRRLYEARHGSAEAQAAFRRVGLTGEQVRGFQNSQQALESLSDRFAGIQDPVKKMALAQELLGRGSLHMVGFLSKGSAAIRAQGDEAERLGIILGGKQVEALEELARSFHKFYGLLRQIGAVIASQIAPVFTFLIDDTLKWFRANKDIVGLNIREFLQSFAYGLGFVYGLVKALVAGFLSLARAMHMDGHVLLLMTKFAGLVGGILAVIRVARILAVVWALMASPIVAVAAAIGAVVVAAHDLYELFKGGDTWTGKAFKAMTGGFGVGDIAKSFMGALSGPNAGMIGLMGASPAAQAAQASEINNVQGGAVSTSVTAPITINATGADPREVAQKAKEGVMEHLGRVQREIHRSTQSAVAY